MKWTMLVASAGLLACGKSDAPAKAPTTKETTARLAGIWPEQWTCDHVGSEAEIGQAVGGKARLIDGVGAPPAGVPRPCSYVVDVGTADPEAWTFDIDCRDSYKQKADALFAQYEQDSTDMVALYNAVTDAATAKPAVKPTPGELDAAPHRAPEAAHPVPIGARGLDHHGQGLLFIDDDAPCYVRVVGPDADRRLALARLVVSRLTLANAPMTPRAAP